MDNEYDGDLSISFYKAPIYKKIKLQKDATIEDVIEILNMCTMYIEEGKIPEKLKRHIVDDSDSN